MAVWKRGIYLLYQCLKHFQCPAKTKILVMVLKRMLKSSSLLVAAWPWLLSLTGIISGGPRPATMIYAKLV